VDVARSEKVEKELDAMVERRSRKGEVDPDEQDERWKMSAAAYNAARIEENRQAWREHHQRQAACLRATLGALIARHEEQAERYRDQQIGEA
jgi:hypothetical protein